MSAPYIFCAIDTPDLESATILAKKISGAGIGIKIGLEFFSANGAAGVEKLLHDADISDFFLDLKFHDIPNTVAGAVKAVSHRLKPLYLNVHAAGGSDMMKAAREACATETKLLAVTVLTSLDEAALTSIGQRIPAYDQVLRLADLTQQAGLDGVVCSAHEIEALRRACGNDFVLMVPGIRPLGVQTGDQKRVMTPLEALQKGATHLVIGRPITSTPDPQAAARDILQSLG
jgi:orotidine-5'-phosphate decarboxylase